MEAIEFAHPARPICVEGIDAEVPFTSDVLALAEGTTFEPKICGAAGVMARSQLEANLTELLGELGQPAGDPG